jgi:hypothetical protein
MEADQGQPRRRRRDAVEGDNILPDGFEERRARHRTNFLHRHDSFRGNHIRQMDLYLGLAERLADEALAFTIAIVCYGVAAGFYTRIGLDRLSADVSRIIAMMVFQVSWIMCYGKILILNVCDILYFPIGSRSATGRFNVLHNNSIDVLEDHDADNFTGFNKAQLQRLFLVWRIPDFFVDTGNGSRFTGEEVMIYYMTNLRKGEPYTAMIQKFGGDPRRFTKTIRLMTNPLYDTFYHKITGDSMRQWLPNITTFQRAIWEKLVEGETVEIREGNRTTVRISVPFENFVVFGFMDDLGIQTCSPGNTARREHGFEDDFQRSSYRYVQDCWLLFLTMCLNSYVLTFVIVVIFEIMDSKSRR